MVTWVGADWDTKKSVVAFDDGSGVQRTKVKRHPRAVKRFVERLGRDKRIVVGIEAGDRLWARLWRQAGADVHVFDGTKSRRYSESLCSSGARDRPA